VNTRLKPLQLSALLHAAALAAFVVMLNISTTKIERIEVPIEVAAPLEAQNLTAEKKSVVLKSVNQPTPATQPTREIFGANRNSYTDESVDANQAVSAKKGNTLTKASDTTTLLDSDADTLPTPTEDYLVSDMPVVKTEIRPTYPESARLERLEGAVVLDILIDDKGVVRQASVVEGAEVFRAGALQAIKRFEFYPAKVEGKPVSVRIRYTLKFQLEY
jgi:TonB family protein